MDKSS